MKQVVILRPYNNKYPNYFKKEKKFLIKHIGKNFEIYHIGSSAVSGLGGKRAVDIILLAATKPKAQRLIKKLESIGYTYNPRIGDENRFFLNRHHFYKGKRIYFIHIYLMWKTNDKYKDYLLFRNYLIKYPEEAKRYYSLKKIWAKKAGAQIIKYPKMKTKYVKEVLKKALKIELSI